MVADNVAGEGFASMLKALRPGGRLVSPGAITGPMVDLDMRDLYLKDLTLPGSTAWGETVFPDRIGAIERGEIRPVVERTYPLASIVEAQETFLSKRHVGTSWCCCPGKADGAAGCAQRWARCWCGVCARAPTPCSVVQNEGPVVDGALVGSAGRIRTYDQSVNSRPLYH